MPKRKRREPPEVGGTFERTYKAKVYRLRIVRVEGGVGFKLGGKLYQTPTAAAKAVVGRDVNGWVFWGIEPREPVAHQPRMKKPRKHPRVGTTFSHTYKGRTHAVRVVRLGDGLGYELGGEVYASPTAAAKAVTGTAVNGWQFWGMDEELP